jgi:hypothetical protein
MNASRKFHLALLGVSWLLTASVRSGEVEALRNALRDPRLSSGPQVSQRDGFLTQLEAIERRLQSSDPAAKSQARSEFARLQREVLLTQPVVCGQPILFVVRHQYRPDHHNTATFFPAAQHEYNDGAFTPGGALKAIDFAQGGEVRTLLESPRGVIRDPEVHFSGQRIVFSMRTNTADSYHLYEIRTDGTGLRQLTFARDVDDIDPLYLPDDRIVFSSTREPKYCGCNRHIMANLFRMDADGANIHQIGKSTLFEGHAALLPDGRILYDRWEYVDRNFGDAQALWTVNPDGTGHAIYWGNNTASPGAVLDGRIIPGSDRVLCIFSSCHDRPWGALGLVDRQLALDGPKPVLRTWPADATNLIHETGWQRFDEFTRVPLKYEDPYPLDGDSFLCSRMIGKGEQMGVYLLDTLGNEVLLHTEAPGCFDPMPLGPRPRPPVIPSRRDFAGAEGVFYVYDVYQGTHVKGVKRGAVKWLRVVEVPEKRFWTRPAWNGQGQEAPAMNWHDFNNKRILGTVPVEEDGSALFAVPAERFVYFQLLDENGMMIQSMRSGTMVQAGETASCVGCHEDRRAAPPVRLAGPGYPPAHASPGTKDHEELNPAYVGSEAATGSPGRGVSRPYHVPPHREPQRLTGWYGPPREFSFLAEVQPVLNKQCLRCHDFGTDGAKALNLAPDRDLVFNVAYNELWRKKSIQVVGAGPSDIQQAYSWGSHASKLGQTLLKNWKNKLTREEFDRIVTWIDLNGPYYPSYASAYPDHLAGRSPLDDPQLARLEQLTGVPLRQHASHEGNRGPQITFDRPELSPCLAKFTDKSDPKYQEALGVIRGGQERLARRPEADYETFQPCELDQWREQKYRVRQQAEQRSREALRSGTRAYDK